MTDVLVKPQPVRRGAHAERTASMRQRLIDAAIECLHTVGYAATTTQLVVDTAEVSRGAILHHFPTKIDLIVAVAEYAAKAQNRYVRRRLADVEPGIERFIEITRATWEVMSQPPGQALLAILMSSRSDPALADALPAVVGKLESDQRSDVCDMGESLGMRDRHRIETMSRLNLATMRGIAIELQLTGDMKRAEDSMAMLMAYKRQITGELLTAPPPA